MNLQTVEKTQGMKVHATELQNEILEGLLAVGSVYGSKSTWVVGWLSGWMVEWLGSWLVDRLGSWVVAFE